MSLSEEREIEPTGAVILLPTHHFIKRCRGQDGITARQTEARSDVNQVTVNLKHNSDAVRQI